MIIIPKGLLGVYKRSKDRVAETIPVIIGSRTINKVDMRPLNLLVSNDNYLNTKNKYIV